MFATEKIDPPNDCLVILPETMVAVFPRADKYRVRNKLGASWLRERHYKEAYIGDPKIKRFLRSRRIRSVRLDAPFYTVNRHVRRKQI